MDAPLPLLFRLSLIVQTHCQTLHISALLYCLTSSTFFFVCSFPLFR
jgi:hypothetical protein